ncbi:helix-turn-helix domain-containing protein [Cohnella silvisoli]|uniref:AraC family transcriptional regulator n=1 Tax=Cohnella silvisoli TaxID=2873699 RepID=A0ABV1KUU0_9BACL|nr:AraC family transcriptional regulator [Cohnella silvisoli]
MEQFQWETNQLQPLVHYANRLACGPGESFGPRIIGDYQWIFVRSGKGKACIGGEFFRAYAGCLFAYGPGEPHWFEASEDDPFVLFGLHFAFAGDLEQEGKEILDHIKNVEWEKMDTYDRNREGSFPRRLETGTWPVPLFEQIIDEFRGGRPMNELLLRGLLTQLIVKVFRWAREERLSGSPLDKLIAKVKEKLEEQAGKSYDPIWLTEWMSYSHDYVSRLFKGRFGMAPHAFHDQARLAVAQRLLEETELTSTSIAEAMQFGSVHYFCKWFKLRTGIQPQEYRNRKRFL